MKKFYILTILALLAFSKKTNAQVTCHASFYLDLSASTLFNGVIVNTSTATGIVPPDSLIFTWTWGDGTSTWGVKYPTHTYSSPGSKKIVLDLMNMAVSCHDSVSHTVIIDSTGTFHKTNGAYTVKVVAPIPQGIHNASLTVFAHMNTTMVHDFAGFSLNGIAEGEMVNVRIYSSDGKMISNTDQQNIGNTLQVSTTSLQSGIYIANLNSNGKAITVKFIKQ